MNGWHRLWILITVIYAGVILVIAISVITDVRPSVSPATLRHVSNDTLRALDATLAFRFAPDGVPSKAHLENLLVEGATIQVPSDLKERAKVTIARDVHSAMQKEANRERLHLVGVYFAMWLVPSILVLAIGHGIAWVLRGFPSKKNA